MSEITVEAQIPFSPDEWELADVVSVNQNPYSFVQGSHDGESDEVVFLSGLKETEETVVYRSVPNYLSSVEGEIKVHMLKEVKILKKDEPFYVAQDYIVEGETTIVYPRVYKITAGAKRVSLL